MNSQRLMIISLAVIVLVLAGFIIGQRLTTAAPSTNLDYDSNPHMGLDSAPVKVAIFFDFLCPHCATFSDQITPILKQEFVDTGVAQLFFFNFPVIDAVVSVDVAKVGECVYQQSNDSFIEFEPIMMRNQANIRTQADAIDTALSYLPDLDGAELRECAAGSEAGTAVAADAAAARAANLTGTPSVLVNGTLVNSSLSAVRDAIERAAK